jgi:hypothetical protein
MSYTTLNETIKRVNDTYSGRGDQIIKSIFREVNGNYKQAPFRIDSECINKGKYVVPNIIARKALNNVVNTSYDSEKTPMMLYQRVCDEGSTRLSSLDFMNENKFYQIEQSGTATYTTVTTLKAAVAGASEDSDGISANETIGTVSKFIVDEHHKNYSGKVGNGYYGHKVKHIKLDETTTKDFPPVEITEIPLTIMKLAKKMYDNDEVSIFDHSFTPEGIGISNMRKRIFNTIVTAADVIAIPGIGCGFCIKIDSGSSNLNYSKMDNNYIIANIHHKFNMQDGEFRYTQDMGLIRDE